MIFTDNSEDTQFILRIMRRYNLLTPEEEKILAYRIRVLHDKKAKDKLVVHNLRIVFSIAKKYTFGNLQVSELFSAGCHGLITAAGRFDERKNVPFASYVQKWIQKEILEFLDESCNMVHLPDSHLKKVSKMKKAICNFEQANHRTPNDEELAELMDTDSDHVKNLRILEAKTFSFDEPIKADEEDGACFVDTMESDVPSTDELLIRIDNMNFIHAEMMRTLGDEDMVRLFILCLDGPSPERDRLIQKLGYSETKLTKVFGNLCHKLRKNKNLFNLYQYGIA